MNPQTEDSAHLLSAFQMKCENKFFLEDKDGEKNVSFSSKNKLHWAQETFGSMIPAGASRGTGGPANLTMSMEILFLHNQMEENGCPLENKEWKAVKSSWIGAL